jgi:hypothetical protein
LLEQSLVKESNVLAVLSFSWCLHVGMVSLDLCLLSVCVYFINKYFWVDIQRKKNVENIEDHVLPKKSIILSSNPLNVVWYHVIFVKLAFPSCILRKVTILWGY